MPASAADFVHLHLHTEYSLLDGFCRMGPLMARAKEQGQKAIAMTDHGYLYGAVEFYKAAKKAELKPIFGCEAYLAPGHRSERSGRIEGGYYHVLLLAKDFEGYQNLMHILSVASMEGFYYRPRADRETLAKHAKGLIATSACLRGEIPCALSKGDVEGARRIAQDYLDMFGRGNFFIELMDHNIEEQAQMNRQLIELATAMDIPLVATNDVHYLDAGDAVPHDVLLCIQMGKTLEDKNRLRFGSDQFYMKSGEEMSHLFRHYPEAVANTARIAEMCNVELDLKTFHMPKFPVDPVEYPGHDDASLLEHLCREALPQFYGADPAPEVLERLAYELGVIKQMGFPSYFLIIWDFIRFSRSQGIPVGPGRGSAAGSIVAYLLGITQLDPLRFGLIFERFLNPSRKEMPDVDTDFCVERRGEVIEYVRRKYGDDRVSQIITFGRLKARASIRDVGRVLDYPLWYVDKVAKTVPAGPKVTLKSAIDESPDFARMYNDDTEARKIIDLARSLEGVPRNASIHAAGVIISKDSLPNHVPLQKMNDKDIVAQFEMGPVGEIGLVKMDFLGLRNLTVIEHCLQIIEERHGQRLDLLNMPDDDPKVFELLQVADTTGIFQFESSGMRRYLRQLKPDRFADIVAMVALYRPGPIQGGMVEKYIDRRHGREVVEYPHPDLEPVLNETYGIILYQEQVMQIASVMGGYTMALADELRKAMGKKKADLMAKHRELFVNGGVERGYGKDLATYVFDLMETFAGYGFNKSHSAAYGIVTYHTAYLKAHYPWEYMCALMTSVMDKIDKVSFFVNEARASGIPVLPPDVNESGARFTVVDAGVRFGMGAIRNVGLGAIEAIVHARKKDGPYKSLYDFCERVDAGQVNKRVVESLIKAGAMDRFDQGRATLLANLDICLDAGTRAQKDKSTGQIGLFDAFEEDDPTAGLVLMDMPEFDKPALLAMEKEMLGLYLSDTPLNAHKELLETEAFTPIARLMEVGAGNRVVVGGIISSLRKIITKTKNTMAFIQLEGMIGNVEVVAFSSTYERCASILADDAMVAVKGLIESRAAQSSDDEEGAEPAGEEVKLLADDFVLLEGLAPEAALALLNAPVEQRGKWPRREKPAQSKSTYKPPPGSSADEDWASRADDRLEGGDDASAAPAGEAQTAVSQAPETAAQRPPAPTPAAARPPAPARPPERTSALRPNGAPPPNGSATKSAPAPARPPAPAPPPPAPEPAHGTVHLRLRMEDRPKMPLLRDLIERHSGAQSVYLHLESPAGRTVMALDDQFQVNPLQDFISGAERLLGPGSVWMERV